MPRDRQRMSTDQQATEGMSGFGGGLQQSRALAGVTGYECMYAIACMPLSIHTAFAVEFKSAYYFLIRCLFVAKLVYVIHSCMSFFL